MWICFLQTKMAVRNVLSLSIKYKKNFVWKLEPQLTVIFIHNFNLLIILSTWSVIHQKIVKNAHYNLSESKVTSSNVQNPERLSLVSSYDNEKQKILRFKKLGSANIWCFCLNQLAKHLPVNCLLTDGLHISPYFAHSVLFTLNTVQLFTLFKIYLLFSVVIFYLLCMSICM